ncbi:MAG: hypothetical protein QOD42_2743 [Sphingomonadales bacterium]|jgi:hypothetical protein|nr:hypothetical protein [Sphingomonadales bacterium]
MLKIKAAKSKKAGEATKTAAPKRRGRSFLLDLLLPMAIAKDVQANLNEVMPVWLEQHGQRKARFIRAVQIGRIIIGHWSRPLVKMARRFVGL